MEVVRFAREDSDVPIAVWQMPDRRTAAGRVEKWILQAQARARRPRSRVAYNPKHLCAHAVERECGTLSPLCSTSLRPAS